MSHRLQQPVRGHVAHDLAGHRPVGWATAEDLPGQRASRFSDIDPCRSTLTWQA
jgi:hypothetical protein